MGLSGHCLCGKTTYEIDAEKPDAGVLDHCDACQRQTGSTYSLVALFPKSKVTIKGPTKEYAKAGDSGKLVRRIFCSECGSPIAHAPDAAPELIAIKAGTLSKKDKQNFKVDLELYTQDKLSCCTEKPEKSFTGMPPA
ncbi:hypothetical protein HKX48_007350 [Thoreauomyces humboldtii]|nr:hypothetical protein HKX48_007350 [Thoreauomyces humboldtii]